MKKQIVSLVIAGLLLIASAATISCSDKHSQKEQISSSSPKANKPIAETYDTMPYGDQVVELDASVPAFYDTLRTVLTEMNKPYTIALANKLKYIDTLIANYGYRYTTSEALLYYYDIVDYVDSMLTLLTNEDLSTLENYI